MFRIDDTTASATLPAPTPAGAPGYFSDGSPVSAIPPTTVTADWFNMIQEEIMSVIAAAAIEPDKANYGQLLAAILALRGDNYSGSLTSPGWMRHPNGVIEQWGRAPVTYSGGSVADAPITFPIEFPHAAWSITGNADNFPATTPGASWDALTCIMRNLTTAGAVATVDCASPTIVVRSGINVFWRAIGN